MRNLALAVALVAALTPCLGLRCAAAESGSPPGHSLSESSSFQPGRSDSARERSSAHTRKRARGLQFLQPLPEQLSLVGEPLEVALRLPPSALPETLEILVDGAPAALEDLSHPARRLVSARVPGLTAGRHQLIARVETRLPGSGRVRLEESNAESWVETVDLAHPDECEQLINVECLLPFPSARFLEPADTVTGYRVRYPQIGMPSYPKPLLATAFDGNDGFSPMVQILTHFPGAVDPVLSDASRLLPETRSYGTRSLEPSSPTLLFDVDAGMKPVLHFIERDARAKEEQSERELLYLRPGVSLTPGHRYIVAMRRLRHPDGSPVEAEPVFAALRDRRPTTIPGVEERRRHFEKLFKQLQRARVSRQDLVLAFDFVVQSDQDSTREMLAMRDRAFAWLDAEGPRFQVFPFVDTPAPGQIASRENDCSAPGQATWREIQGTFAVPLFLDSDPLLDPPRLSHLVDDDGDGLPDAQGTMNANFSITIPCRVLEEGGAPLPPLLVGHGLFGNGRGMVGVAPGLSARLQREGFGGFDKIGAATDFLGLSSFDFSLGESMVVNILRDLDEFGAMPDRLRQGMTNTLVLARMLKQGHFNAHTAFRTPEGVPVLAGPEAELGYLGISLGGIMGIFFSALSPDVGNVSVDIPASNFSMLVQRSGAVGAIGTIIAILNPDPMTQGMLWGIVQELWSRGEPAGYLTHVTRNPLPGSGDPKKLLMTVARFDGIVPNEASEITARTLGLPNLRSEDPLQGSVISAPALVPNVPGPLAPDDPGFVGAQIWYDIHAYDLENPEHEAFIPPLENVPPGDGGLFSFSPCEPHGRTFQILAEQLQIARWLQTEEEVDPSFPGEPGVIESYCDGLCDGLDAQGQPNPDELANGQTEFCDPLAG
jgi:hypothetical protein